LLKDKGFAPERLAKPALLAAIIFLALSAQGGVRSWADMSI
jgi:hypothetical protein